MGILEATFGQTFVTVKIVFIILDVILIGIFFLSLYKLFQYRPPFILNPHKKVKKKSMKNAKTVARWNAIKNKFEAGNEDSIRFAIVDADGMVDDVLKRMGLPGDTFAERFARLTPQNIKSQELVWRAHKLRNELVHSPDYKLSDKEARSAMRAYEAFLKEVKVI